MKPHQLWVFAASVCMAFLAACSGGSDGNSAATSGSNPSSGSVTTPPQTSAYTITNLVSDGAVPADSVDKDLKNPWGIAFDPLGPTWLADNGTNLSTLYIDLGIKFPITVSIPAGTRGPAQPTGIVYNGSLTEFMIGKAGAIGSAQFIYAGQGGTIAAWSELTLSNVDMGAETLYDDGPGGAIYTGLALAKNGSADFLYAADFHNAKVDVFDKTFKKVTSSGGFADPALPAGYAPFNVQAVGDQLYVSYALQQGPDNQHEQVGPGLGLVNLFNADGTLVRRVANGGPLNAPWGIAWRPPTSDSSARICSSAISATAPSTPSTPSPGSSSTPCVTPAANLWVFPGCGASPSATARWRFPTGCISQPASTTGPTGSMAVLRRRHSVVPAAARLALSRTRPPPLCFGGAAQPPCCFRPTRLFLIRLIGSVIQAVCAPSPDGSAAARAGWRRRGCSAGRSAWPAPGGCWTVSAWRRRWSPTRSSQPGQTPKTRWSRVRRSRKKWRTGPCGLSDS